MTKLVLGVEDFPASTWGTPVEKERRRRIQVAVAAYAYELAHDPIMDDSSFDYIAQQIDKTIDTGNAELDDFFRNEFSPMTGMWIYQHPDIAGVKRAYERFRRYVPR